MFVPREHKYIIVGCSSGLLCGLPGRIFPLQIVLGTHAAGRNASIPLISWFLRAPGIAAEITHFPNEDWPCGKNDAGHGLLPLGFLRRVAEKEPEDNEREQVEKIDVPGARDEQDNSEDCHTKGDEELFCEE